jgi:lysophospholipase L1-like esterase
MKRGWIPLAALLTAACGSTPSIPTPVANAPQIACPADATVRGITGATQPVTFNAPTVTDGTAPVNVSCSQTSGAAFPLGTTTVTCTAIDARSRQAACAFNVTLTALALGVKRFETMGDSLTEGENGAGARPTFVDQPNSYPAKLQALLDATFPGQGLTVINRGESGKTAQETEAHIPGFLATDRPDAVLLLTGYNNLTSPCGIGLSNSAGCGQATQDVAFGVRDCIRRVKESPVGVRYILVSTLTPPGPTGSRRIERDAIIEANRKIRSMVASENVTLVDTFPVFLGHEAEYVSLDGLHLNPPGYQAIADTFFAAIRATIPQTSLVTSTGSR